MSQLEVTYFNMDISRPGLLLLTMICASITAISQKVEYLDNLGRNCHGGSIENSVEKAGARGVSEKSGWW